MCLSRDEYIAKTDMNDGNIRYTSLPTSRGKTRGIRRSSVKLLWHVFPPFFFISLILKKHVGLCNKKNKYDYLFIELG